MHSKHYIIPFFLCIFSLYLDRHIQISFIIKINSPTFFLILAFDLIYKTVILIWSLPSVPGMHTGHTRVCDRTVMAINRFKDSSETIMWCVYYVCVLCVCMCVYVCMYMYVCVLCICVCMHVCMFLYV